MRARKGSKFERTICKRLSLWWTHNKRDDVFWRSSQSGGRATQRAKKGKRTYGSYGDVAAVDPIGDPLLKVFTIELKRGSSHGSPGDLLDFKEDNASHPWVQALLQAVVSHRNAGSQAWLLICKRDHRLPIAYLERRIFKWLLGGPIVTDTNMMLLSLHIRREGEACEAFTLVGLPLECLLKSLEPEQVANNLARLFPGQDRAARR